MRALLLLLTACAVQAPPLSAKHPASPQADGGRLAGAPASLRTGIVEYKDVPAVPQQPAVHHHHH